MGFFDLFASRKNQPKPGAATPAQTPAPQPPVPAAQPVPSPAPQATAPTPAGTTPLKERLRAAREKLDAKDLAGALAIYDELLASAGDRADILVSLSGDLGACGYVDTIIEIVAPRYDAERHGPAAGLNLLQAYLITRQPEPAQHLLDILFALNKPELEQRLHGFSNALADLIEAQRRGEMLPQPAPATEGGAAPAVPQAPKTVSLASISKPIWAYGVETVPGLLPPAKDGKLRRVAFGQLAIVDAANQKLERAEDDLCRFARGFPLWMAETFYFSPHYAPIAALGLLGKDRLATFPAEWTQENIRQLVQTASDGVDYVFTGALQVSGTDRRLTLRVWEVKKMRERKQFTAEWSGDGADAALLGLHEQIRLFMEWQTHPAVAAYAPPASPSAWCDSLALSLALFLADKGVVPASQVDNPAEVGARLASRGAASERDAVCWYTGVDRARRIGAVGHFPVAAAPHTGPLAEAARTTLGL
ncbi:hypothetical protein [Nibricoccus sp. IMCC34717]|uniref:hypothetical protein n=1 Tax=Nibricoccus sp. IMCC34717 TaxID=3034021 RepID=UPI00384B15BD